MFQFSSSPRLSASRLKKKAKKGYRKKKKLINWNSGRKQKHTNPVVFICFDGWSFARTSEREKKRERENNQQKKH
jgi:hypothetical protein